MHFRRTLVFGSGLLMVCALVAPQQEASADDLLFKDGFLIKGRMKYESTSFSDSSSGAVITIPALGKPYWLDDGVRMVYFSPGQLQDAIKVEDKEAKADWVKFEKTKPGGSGRYKLPLMWQISKVDDWDEHWQRKLTLELPNLKNPSLHTKTEVKQRITQLTPEILRIDAVDRDWTCCYKTGEVSPAALRDLIQKYYSIDAKMKGKDFEQHALVYKFLLQAGYVGEAGKQLEYMLTRFPAQESSIKPLLNNIKGLQALDFVDALQRAAKVGMHSDVAQKLKEYASQDLDKLLSEAMQLQVQGIKDKYESLQEKTKEARQQLQGFAGITPPAKREFFQAVAAAIAEEVGPDTVGRLETFASQAQDYLRAVKDNRKPEQTAAEIMAFAITGWLRGSDAAERNIDVALKQWDARELLIEYFKTADASTRRNKLIPALAARGLTVDEAMQILNLLPPAEPEAKISSGPVKLTTGSGSKSITYHVQLPPGYTHGHGWPVLIVLHHSQESAEKALLRWTDLAARHGYVLAAPQWGKSLRSTYTFTAPEHAFVLETLRDLRRRFNIDSDRVFLFGGEEGANMAFDVGLAHPDQFAGVIPMSGSPRYFAKRCWSNAQYLNLYVINGEKTGLAAEMTKMMLKDFIHGNFPAIYVEYKGRPSDWFPAEQPIIFDWMNRKKRAHPLKEVGRAGEEFKTARNSDNSFYWISTDLVQPAYVTSADKWDATKFPATLTASVYTDNTIIVKTHGVGTVTIWFGPKLVEYKDKVTIKLNGGSPITRTITPNLETLLENQYYTADRQRVFFARVDVR